MTFSGKKWNPIRQDPEYYFDESDGLYKIKELKGVLSVSDEKENKVEVVNPGPAHVMNQYVVIALTVLMAIAGVLSSIPGLPPVVHAISAVVVAIGVALGIASPGIKAPAKNQDSLK